MLNFALGRTSIRQRATSGQPVHNVSCGDAGQHEYRRVGDASYFVVERGSGPPVLLLHGFPETYRCWDRVVPRLAETYRVVTPDLRGYGASQAPSGGPDGEGYSKREMAAELVELMAGMGHERFVVVGHDRGARAGRLPDGARPPWRDDPSRSAECLADGGAVRADGRRTLAWLLAVAFFSRSRPHFRSGW
jgi:pimeloyl-ACP methyl ester carboxylesterase